MRLVPLLRETAESSDSTTSSLSPHKVGHLQVRKPSPETNPTVTWSQLFCFFNWEKLLPFFKALIRGLLLR